MNPKKISKKRKKVLRKKKILRKKKRISKKKKIFRKRKVSRKRKEIFPQEKIDALIKKGKERFRYLFGNFIFLPSGRKKPRRT